MNTPPLAKSRRQGQSILNGIIYPMATNLLSGKWYLAGWVKEMPSPNQESACLRNAELV